MAGDPAKFIDTNCYLLAKEMKELVSIWWQMDDKLYVVGDRVMFNTIRDKGLFHRHTFIPTVYYRTAFQSHYDHFDLPHPPGSKPQIGIGGKP